MSCIRNPKKFLFVKWHGPHKVKDTYIKKCLTDNYYELHQECSECGVDLGYNMVTENQLLHRGYNLEKLRELAYGYGLKSAEELVCPDDILLR